MMIRKKLFAFFVFLPAFIASSAQINDSIVGVWTGKLNAQGSELRVVFHITKEGDSYQAKMDSPDQGAFGIEAGEVKITNDDINLGSKKAMFLYEARWERAENRMSGLWKQGGFELPLNLEKTYDDQAVKLNRPQEPKAPFPYIVEDIVFENKEAAIKLSGTLTRPAVRDPVPAVILVTGSGPQNRDEEILGHKPFLIIADYLTRNGFAVLRYDERGVGESEGDFATATIPDFAADAEAAFDYLLTLKYINKDKIGIMGHSEGGMVAPMIAARRADLGYIVMLAGPGTALRELLLDQSELILKASGYKDEYIAFVNEMNAKIYDILLKNPDKQKAANKIRKYMLKKRRGLSEDRIRNMNLTDKGIEGVVRSINTDYFRFFLAYDPAPALKETKCPVLAVNGTKDLQVPAKKNLDAIEKALKEGGNKNYKTKAFEELNHLFQPAETGLPTEYVKIEITFDESALEYIKVWLMGVVK